MIKQDGKWRKKVEQDGTRWKEVERVEKGRTGKKRQNRMEEQQGRKR